MGFKFNPFTSNFDLVGKEYSPTVIPYTFLNVNVWENVSNSLGIIYDAEAYDQGNNEKIEIAIKINGNVLQVKSSKLITVNLKIHGE